MHSVLAVLAGLLLAGCSGKDSLQQVLERGELIVATRNGPTTYFIDKGDAAGFEHELVSRFAEELGVEVSYRSRHNIGDIFDDIRRAQVDFAAAGLSVTPSRAAEFRFGAPYYDIDPQIIYLAGTAKPRSVEDLYDGRVVTMSNSSHAETMAMLREDYPDLEWQEIDDVEPLDLMDMVTTGSATYAVIDSNEFIANRSFHPKLRVGFNLGEQQTLSWLFSQRPEDDTLWQAANDFLTRLEEDGTLSQLKERQFGHAWGVDQVDSQTFNRRMRQRLPKYETMIRQVATEYQLDWQLLAAISYQESHWNPRARSPTGVRGMMMLTQSTAREMDVRNRLDALESLRGGARYFKKIKRLLPADVLEPDRTWFALAAYNIGRGHLNDARVITERQGGDPHLWSDVKERLPLLQRSKYYKTVKHGYARGNEPVTYVKNIRHYYNILAWQDIAANRPPPPVDAQEYVPDVVKAVDLTAL
ncbi:MAG: membrane-bound lytic murein transglycosylase MltF [Halieaceae bacterium]|nr:membrane-bound lytic murein transglycosylase MltF [Halieaceae bacterium]